MTPERLKECLGALGISRRGFSRLMNCGETSVRDWEKGKYSIPLPIQKWLEDYMEWLKNHPVPVKKKK